MYFSHMIADASAMFPDHEASRRKQSVPKSAYVYVNVKFCYYICQWPKNQVVKE